MDLKGWGYANCDVRAYIAAIEIMQVRTLTASLLFSLNGPYARNLQQ
jgi:hypothetical protein